MLEPDFNVRKQIYEVNIKESNKNCILLSKQELELELDIFFLFSKLTSNFRILPNSGKFQYYISKL